MRCDFSRWRDSFRRDEHCRSRKVAARSAQPVYRVRRAHRTDLAFDRFHERRRIVDASGLDDDARNPCARMSASGLPRTTTRSAHFPASIEPSRSPSPMARALLIVAIRSTAAFGMPRARERLQLAMHRERREELAPARMIGAERDEIAAAGVVERLDLLSLRPIDVLELLRSPCRGGRASMTPRMYGVRNVFSSTKYVKTSGSFFP